jgi:hypothetical protein
MNQNYQNRNYKKKPQGPTLLEVIFVGIFKALWFLIKLPFRGIKKKQGITGENRTYIITKRQEIESLLNSESEIELKHAVMEADKLVDHVLRIKGHQGETFADRLRSAQGAIESNLYDKIWQGHKVRNQLAHENELRITNNELREAANKLLSYIRTV